MFSRSALLAVLAITAVSVQGFVAPAAQSVSFLDDTSHLLLDAGDVKLCAVDWVGCEVNGDVIPRQVMADSLLESFGQPRLSGWILSPGGVASLSK